MVLVPSGEFLMGDSAGFAHEKPVRKVKVQGFYMDQTPVTYADFIKYVDDGGSKTRYWDYSSYNIPEQPVTGISWYHAINYCNWRSHKEGLSPAYIPTGKRDAWGLEDWRLDTTANGYRLPTEAEWEYAARGGLEQKDYPWGDDFTDSWANYDTDKGHKESEWWRLAPVNSQKKNNYDLYGMAGNVWEWCTDWYDEGTYTQMRACNPKNIGAGRSRVMRGGGWGSPSPEYLKVFRRSYAAPSNYNYAIGFRCVRPVDAEKTTQRKDNFQFYRYPDKPDKLAAIDTMDFYSEAFTQKLSRYFEDNFAQCLYFLQAVDGQPKVTPNQLAQLIVEECKQAKINPLFVTAIMISESGFATVSFPRWWNNPMAYHWQNRLMARGKPTYNADKSHNRRYKDLRAAIRNYSRIRRSIYYEKAQKDLYAFHKLYVGYEAKEWMYTVGKVFREVAGLHIAPHEPNRNVGKFIYSDWK